MQLLFDIGNTYCKSAMLIDGVLTQHQIVQVQENPDRCTEKISPLEVRAVWVASVRDEVFNLCFSENIERLVSVKPEFATISESACGVTSKYATTLGVDRLMALIAAWQKFKTACVVIDCGTAVTIDALDGAGVHQGGLIMPGLDMLKK